MAGPTKQASAATTALIYLTAGALMIVWTGIYYIYLNRQQNPSDNAYLWCYGFMASGVVLVGIGLALGRIGRATRPAEVGPGVASPNGPAENAVAAPVVVQPTTAVPPGAAVQYVPVAPPTVAPPATGVR